MNANELQLVKKAENVTGQLFEVVRTWRYGRLAVAPRVIAQDTELIP
jgi:hypothetical protein